ncbi:hypothetical protein [Serratia marcescens]|uniref:hypothetical protein n=1 Tax=Serratia marcescens TaxID=615 RepID=UPI000A198D4F|nr:hypothetical protein [Serratia marcescens]
MAVEINKLINERRIGVDDGCDYGAVIIDNLNAAARARTRACYQPPVRAPFVSRPQGDDSPVVKIGNRNVYGRKVITGIYQLHLSGRTPVQIARLLKMPLHRVEHLLRRETSVRREIFRNVSTQPLPTEAEIMRCLAAESKA